MHQYYSKVSLASVELYSVENKKKKAKNEEQYICIKTYLEPLPLSEKEREIIEDICQSEDVFYKPRKILTTLFLGAPEPWQVHGHRSREEFLHWLWLNRRDNP